MSWQPICGECAWRGKRTSSSARAEHAGRLHSCDAYRRREASRERGRALRAAVDRTPKPCRHKQANHQHGTNACYHLDNCRCTPCSRAAVAYDRARTRQTAYGRWQPYVDAQPVREHVATLAAAGMGLKTVARRSGVAHGALWKLMYGRRAADDSRTPSRLVRRETAEALLAMRANLDTLADGAYVDSTGTQRRVQALMAAGWSLSQQAAHLGVTPTNFPQVLRRRQVWARTARAVRAMYAELSTTPPPETSKVEKIAASRSRNYARMRGWKPPVWWDEEWFDDTNFLPVDAPALNSHDDVDPVAVERACSGDRSIRLTIAERREAVRALHARGLRDRPIARALGLTDRTVLRIRQELGLPAVEAAA